MTLTIDIDGVMAFEPCAEYTRERVAALAAGRERWTAAEIIREHRGRVPIYDILWLVLRPEMIEHKTLVRLVCDFAERALLAERARGREPHADSWAAIETARRWLQGDATIDEVRAAAEAAWVAAEVVSASAAEARAAVRAAVRAAASVAAARAASSAAEAAWASPAAVVARRAAAAWVAAWEAAAEQAWQLDHALSVLEDIE